MQDLPRAVSWPYFTGPAWRVTLERLLILTCLIVLSSVDREIWESFNPAHDDIYHRKWLRPDRFELTSVGNS